MSDYKFEILSILVKYDEYELDTVLFGKNLDKYDNILQKMYWHEHLVDRTLFVGEGYKTKITDKGRDYYFDTLLPNRTQHSVTSGTWERHKQTILYGIIISLFAALVTIIVKFLGR